MINNDDIIQELEQPIKKSFRPIDFENFMGQKRIIKQLNMMIHASNKLQKNLDHLIFFGAPGLGKTTLASLVSNAVGSNLVYSQGQSLTKIGDVAAILSNLKENDILFVDEVHRLKPNVQEFFYTALEDFYLDIVIGKGPSAKSMRLDLQPFTFIGATTRLDKLTQPFRDRFGVIFKFEEYTEKEIAKILKVHLATFDLSIEDSALDILISATKSVPRIAINTLKRVHEYCLFHDVNKISKDHILECLSLLSIDETGLNQFDFKFLDILSQSRELRPIGVKTLSSMLGEEVDYIESICEPFLLKNGLIQKTSNGRIITTKGLKFLSDNKLKNE